MNRTSVAIFLPTLAVSGALAQPLELSHFTIDSGGGTCAGGNLTLTFTLGQPESGSASGGSLQVGCGFWPGSVPACYPNCDLSTTPPILNVNDFACYLNAYAAGDTYSNCDASTTPPVLNVQDFACFLNAFAAGCP